MIGQLRGIILEKTPPQLLIEVQGIGYEVDAPMSTFYHLPDVGAEVVLYTHFVVREDAQLLYGFYARDERALFKTLLKVNGVGPKLALAILSSMDANAFIRCVMENDTDSLVRMPGVGKKTAERLIVEMRDKVSHLSESATLKAPNAIHHRPLPVQHQAMQDAVSALIALGYKPQEASRALSKVQDENLSSEELIRHALKEMVV